MHPLISKGFQINDFHLSDLKSSGNLVTHLPTSRTFLTRVATGASLPQMVGEAAGLKAMNLTSTDLAPEIIALELSEDGREGGMITQYWDLGGSSKSCEEGHRALARKIAGMHTPPPGDAASDGYTGKYGFEVPTHCGVTQLDNTWEESWEVFYRDRRLGDIINRIGDDQINTQWEKMKEKVVPLLLRRITPAPKPVICHGDLWSGNAGVDKQSGDPVIWDPACYWGHNESDLGVMHMFGGFTREFFDEYHKVHRRSSPHYHQRQTLYELWHHLNHTLMFGGSYKSGALRMMKELNAWAEEQEQAKDQ